MSNINICMLIVLGTYGTALLIYLLTRDRERRLRIKTCDFIAASFVVRTHLNDAGFLAFLVWTVVSVVINLLIPASFASKSGFLTHPFGMIIVIDYAVMVPLLVGSYFYLLQSSDFLYDDETMITLGFRENHVKRSNTENIQLFALHAMVIIAALTILYSGVKSEIDIPSPHTPWLNRAVTDLSFWGIWNYWLRGIDAYMALGMMVTIFTLWWKVSQIMKLEDPVKLYDNQLKVRPEIRRLCLAFLFCVVLGTVITSLHGAALFTHGFELQDKSLTVTLISESTWVIWVILTVITTSIVIYILCWFNRNLSRAVDLKIADRMREIDTAQRQISKPTLTDQKNYWDLLSSMTTVLSRTPVWPLPRSGGITIGLTVSLQIINVLTAIYGLKALFS